MALPSDSSANSTPVKELKPRASVSLVTRPPTALELHKVAELRQLLGPLNRHPDCDDAQCLRYVRATGGNVAHSAKRLAATLKWRDTNKPQEVVCHACRKDPKSHYMHIVGHDNLGRPIIYSCLAAATNKSFQENHDHMIEVFELAIRMMPPGVDQWVWVCDFHGFGFVDCNPKLAKAFLSVSAEHYPERLGLFLIVDAPSLFSVLWRAISAFVDPKTHEKIRFLPYDLKSPKSLLRQCVTNFCDAEVSSWLITEIAENRDNKKVKHKAYNLENLRRMARSGELRMETQQQDDKTHDLRGSRKLLNLIASSPSIIAPPNTAAHA